jgi:hypothetical protein
VVKIQTKFFIFPTLYISILSLMKVTKINSLILQHQRTGGTMPPDASNDRSLPEPWTRADLETNLLAGQEEVPHSGTSRRSWNSGGKRKGGQSDSN